LYVHPCQERDKIFSTWWPRTKHIYVYVYTHIYIYVHIIVKSVNLLICTLVFWVVTLCSLVGGYVSEIHAVCCYSYSRYVRKQRCFLLLLCSLPNTMHVDSCRNHHYFMSLLLQRFVLTVQSRLCQPQHTNCQMCGEFESIGLLLFWNITIFSHSGFGEGELAHHLLKGEVSVQRLLAVSIPYVVRLVEHVVTSYSYILFYNKCN
jgi:hypothetical protein